MRADLRRRGIGDPIPPPGLFQGVDRGVRPVAAMPAARKGASPAPAAAGPADAARTASRSPIPAAHAIAPPPASPAVGGRRRSASDPVRPPSGCASVRPMASIPRPPAPRDGSRQSASGSPADRRRHSRPANPAARCRRSAAPGRSPSPNRSAPKSAAHGPAGSGHAGSVPPRRPCLG